MTFNERNLIVAESLDGIFSDEMTGYITHAYCTAGSCAIVYNGERLTFGRGDLMILLFNRMVTAVEPSEDFSVRVIFIHLQFLEACTPHTSYGVAGGLTMICTPFSISTGASSASARMTSSRWPGASETRTSTSRATR